MELLLVKKMADARKIAVKTLLKVEKDKAYSNITLSSVFKEYDSLAAYEKDPGKPSSKVTIKPKTTDAVEFEITDIEEIVFGKKDDETAINKLDFIFEGALRFKSKSLYALTRREFDSHPHTNSVNSLSSLQVRRGGIWCCLYYHLIIGLAYY